MEESKTIYTSVINIKHFFVSMLLVVSIGTALTILIAMRFHSEIVIPIGILIFWLGPALFFQNQLRKPFTKKATLNFRNDCISVGIFNKKNGELEQSNKIRFDEIKSFKAMNSTKDDSSFLKINFKNGSKLSYTFLQQSKENTKSSITSLVAEYIHLYNIQNENKTIILAPSFFASKVGTYCIAGLTIILIAAVLLQTIYKPKTIPFTLFAGAILYLQIITQRKRDIRDMENFNK